MSVLKIAFLKHELQYRDGSLDHCRLLQIACVERGPVEIQPCLYNVLLPSLSAHVILKEKGFRHQTKIRTTDIKEKRG